MGEKHTNDRLQGTLDLVVLKTLDARPHERLRDRGAHREDFRQRARLEEGSLYPALHRMTNGLASRRVG